MLLSPGAYATDAPANGVPASATPAPTNDYRLGSGDLVRMNVFGAPEMTTDARVAESGTITFPLIGSVKVAGLST
ncbi:MAG TPA: polysaccharide biosynthesis/export family protein, partial [Povalibacter sp.]|nr:polysaccharide biosynthesis/export family protein [Povalibacter sp.]